MRLLFLNPIGNIGGAERVLLTAIAGVKREQPNTVVRLISLSEGPLLEAARELGAETEVVALPAAFGQLGDSKSREGRLPRLFKSIGRLPTLAFFMRRLKAAVARFGPDLVHSNGIKTHLFSRYVVPSAVPVVWHLHDFYGLRPTAGWLLRRARSRVRAAVAISNAVAYDTRKVVPELRVEVILNAADLEMFAPGPGDGSELDRRAGLSEARPGTVRVGLVATFARWKGQLTVIEAAARLAAESPDLPVRWYIIGGPIYQTAAQFTAAELQSEVKTRGLVDRVGFVGFVPETAPIYRALDVVVHASTQPEPFGLTVAEAMACGRAVIVSNAGGAAELFTDGKNAIGIAPGDVHQLAAAVRKLVENPDLRARLGSEARSTATQRFDANRYGGQLCKLYQSILAANSSR